MVLEKIHELTFGTYEDASVFIDRQILAGGACGLTVRADDFIVDVFDHIETDDVLPSEKNDDC